MIYPFHYSLGATWQGRVPIGQVLFTLLCKQVWFIDLLDGLGEGQYMVDELAGFPPVIQVEGKDLGSTGGIKW